MAHTLLRRAIMANDQLDNLRDEIAGINRELLALLNRRAATATEILKLKQREGIPVFVPEREQQMLDELRGLNQGPFSDETVCRLFKEIFKASVDLMEQDNRRQLRISRARQQRDAVIAVRGATIGGAPELVAGPCAVESEEQMERVASFLASRGVRFLRGGAFKPRTSPYSFQGLGEQGLVLLRRAAQRHGLVTVTEVIDTRTVELVARHADILQIGARNMYNYELLREVGRCGKPVLLKRGLSATVEELLWAAEYIALEGNEQVILCERGIRTFERETRNTLDLSAVVLLRRKTFLPVLVDLSHATGRKDILAPLGRAALAAGANGLMVEVHPAPAVARSDGHQQLDLPAFDQFLGEVGVAPAGATGLRSAGAR